MKEFQSLRAELNEGVTDLAEHIAIANSSMPPNILILRRKTVRQFPNNTMVALYYNDKLGQYFSIPYGGDAPGVVTPVALKETMDIGTQAFHTAMQEKEIQRLIDKPARSEAEQKEHEHKKDLKNFRQRQLRAPGKSGKSLKEDARGFDGVIGEDGRSLDIDGHNRAQWMDKFEKHVVAAKPEHAGKIDWHTASYLHSAGHKPQDAATLYHTRRRDLKESVIDQLKHIKDFHAMSHITHADKTRTHVDPTTASVLLKVHDALHPDNREKFAAHLEHSKPKFHKMLDFAWKQVK